MKNSLAGITRRIEDEDEEISQYVNLLIDERVKDIYEQVNKIQSFNFISIIVCLVWLLILTFIHLSG